MCNFAHLSGLTTPGPWLAHGWPTPGPPLFVLNYARIVLESCYARIVLDCARILLNCARIVLDCARIGEICAKEMKERKEKK